MSREPQGCFVEGCDRPAPYGLRRAGAHLSQLKPRELDAQGQPKRLTHCAEHADKAEAHLETWLRGLA